MIDTHAHLYLEDFKSDLKSVVDNSKAKGITTALMPNLEIGTIESMISVETQFPEFCRSMIGLHPCYINREYKIQLAKVRPWLDKHKFVAIGEIGIDLYHSTEFYEEQIKTLEEQLNWAKEYNLPVSIHSRNSLIETINILKKHQNGNLNGVIHCFSGNLEESKKILDLGFKLGIGGVVTFKNSSLKEVIQQTDLKDIVLETDAPYLAPTPFRGKRNEPSYIYNIAQTLASIKEADLETISRITTESTKKLFKL